jgi:hypothetical protein
MEKRINKKLEIYVITLKDDLKKKIIELDFSEKDKINSFLEYLNEYERIIVLKDDLVKRNRVQNAIPDTNRCIAKLQSGEQCTRKKKEDCSFCGTHYKSIPYGAVEQQPTKYKVSVVAHDIMGIIYYIDKENNVYKTEDILENKENPRIIAKATFENDQYRIPNLYSEDGLSRV